MPEVGFLLTPQAMNVVLAKAGFEEVSWIDKTDASREWADVDVLLSRPAIKVRHEQPTGLRLPR